MTLWILGYLKNGPRVKGPLYFVLWIIWGGTRFLLQLMRALPEFLWTLIFVVWVGPGSYAGLLAIIAHTTGIMGRLYGEVYEEVEPEGIAVLESTGVGRFGRWAYGVVPQAASRILSYAFFGLK